MMQVVGMAGLPPAQQFEAGHVTDSIASNHRATLPSFPVCPSEGAEVQLGSRLPVETESDSTACLSSPDHSDSDSSPPKSSDSPSAREGEESAEVSSSDAESASPPKTFLKQSRESQKE